MNVEQRFTFGEFSLLPKQRVLLEAGVPVRIGSRAFDLLTALVEGAGQVVTKEALFARAWPRSVVEESSLRFHIANLRKALGDGNDGARYISNVSGRGYCFVAPVRQESVPAGAEPAETEQVPHKNNLPMRLARMVGRSESLASLVQQLPARRFVTLVGPGGIGKSTLALAAAEQLLSHHPDGVWLVDLSVLEPDASVATAIATVLGVPVRTRDPIRNLIEHLADKRLLLILDNCERVLDSAADTAENLLSMARGVCILATSREATRSRGEWVQQVQALSLPPAGVSPEVAEALKYSAVQLFVERAIASLDSFELTESDVEPLVEICRRLDGLPLCLELAAARVDSFGIRGLLQQLDDRFPLLSQGRRAVPDRHRTLRGLIDWSYDMLTAPEQALLRRLSAFRGLFTQAGAEAVAGDEWMTAQHVLTGIVSLASKSLIAVDSSGTDIRYRMLDTTRAYASERLAESAEHREIRRRHALYLCSVMHLAQAEWKIMSRADWIARFALFLDDVHWALDWLFSDQGDHRIAVRLVAGAIGLGHQTAVAEDFLVRVERALSALESMPEPDPHEELALRSSHANLLTMVKGPAAAAPAYRLALAKAEAYGDDRIRIEALNGLFIHSYFGDSDFERAEAFALDVARLGEGSSDPYSELRLRAQAAHGVGQHAHAIALCQQALREQRPTPQLSAPFPLDRNVSMRMVMARSLWLQGRAGEAIAIIEEALDHARRDVPQALSNVLAWSACPIALWIGDMALAARWAHQLRQHALGHGFQHSALWAEAYEYIIAEHGSPTMPHGTRIVRDTRHLAFEPVPSDIMSTLDVRFMTSTLLRRALDGERGWHVPELLRREAARLCDSATPDVNLARELLRRSFDMACLQDALAWQLRTATSMLRLDAGSKAAADSASRLSRVLEQVRQGFEGQDVGAARVLLQSVHTASPMVNAG